MKFWPFPMSKPDGVTKLNEVENMAEIASKQGVRFLHLRGFNTSCTVAYRPVNMERKGKMLEVAVAYLHPKDTYCRKTGANLVAQRFMLGQTVVLPLRCKEHYLTVNKLREVFLDSVDVFA